jgi:hypothetical protein
MSDIQERVDKDFANWAKRVASKRHIAKLDKKPIGVSKITKEMMNKRSLDDLERELLGEPHIRDILDGPKRRPMNKKGSLIDVILWMVIAFIVIFVFAGFFFMFVTMNSSLSAIPDIPSIGFHNSVAQTFTQVSNAMPILQWVVVAFIFAMILSIFISNFLIKVHPVFFIIYILLVIVAVIFSAYLSNAYETILNSNNALTPTLEQFTGANFIMLNLPYISAIVGVLGSIFLLINIIRDTGGANVI